MATERRTISISAVLADLESGMTRIQIGEKYEITPREVKVLFENPNLKGKKARKRFVPSFEINDDVTNATEEGTEEETTIPEQQNLFD